jgi:hypothetical protein
MMVVPKARQVSDYWQMCSSQTEAVASAWPHAHQSKAEEAPSLASQQSSNSIYRACYLLGILV